MGIEKKIAIVHRDNGLIEALKLIIERLGYYAEGMEVNGSTNPNDVADFVTQYNPHLLFLAENWSGANFQILYNDVITKESTLVDRRGGYRGEGLSAVPEIRKYNKDLPIILMSVSPQYRAEASALGLEEYLSPAEYMSLNKHGELKEFLASRILI